MGTTFAHNSSNIALTQYSSAQQTALLLFSRTPADEAKAKSFAAASGAVNTAIAGLMINHSIQTASASGLPLYTCYSNQQSTGNFGTRLADAMEAVFEQGFERVIVIGNDSPELTTALLQQACTSLLTHPIVLGPALDGGVYLIGLSKTAYNRALFVQLPWETPQVQAAWLTYAPNIEVVWLRPLSDIDGHSDLSFLLRRLPQSSRFRWALAILLQKKHAALPHTAAWPPLPISFSPLHQRGPPVGL